MAQYCYFRRRPGSGTVLRRPPGGLPEQRLLIPRGNDYSVGCSRAQAGLQTRGPQMSGDHGSGPGSWAHAVDSAADQPPGRALCLRGAADAGGVAGLSPPDAAGQVQRADRQSASAARGRTVERVPAGGSSGTWPRWSAAGSAAALLERTWASCTPAGPTLMESSTTSTPRTPSRTSPPTCARLTSPGKPPPAGNWTKRHSTPAAVPR